MEQTSPPANVPPNQAAALSSLKARVQRNPQDGESWLAIALELARASPTPELRQAISRAIELLPDNCQAWLLAGLEFQQRQGPMGARQWLQHVSAQKPELVAPRLALAQLLAANNEPGTGEFFANIIADFTDDPRPRLIYAEYLQNIGRAREAADYLEQALRLAGDKHLNAAGAASQNWIALAKLRLADGRLDDVITAATRALELDGNALEARMTRAEAYRSAAQWQPALDDYAAVLESRPRSPFVMLGMSACLAGQREYAQALDLLQQVLQLQPGLIEARLNVALVHASQGQAARALQLLEPLLASDELKPQQREAALVAQAVLQHQLEVQALLPAAAQSGQVSELQQALAAAPALLKQQDSVIAGQLRSMADACQQQHWPDLDPGAADANEPGDAALESFVEACLLSRSGESSKEIATSFSQLHKDPSGGPAAAWPGGLQALANTWQCVQDRNAGMFRPGENPGQVWLRYWHYRLMEHDALSLPGQFKFAANSIGLHPTAAPQYLAATLQLLLDEIYPALPPGLGRACFIMTALNRVHAFIDGNGRLSRFVLAGEVRSAGLPAIMIQQPQRKEMIDCQDLAKYRKDFSGFAVWLPRLRATTLDLLDRVRADVAQAG